MTVRIRSMGVIVVVAFMACQMNAESETEAMDSSAVFLSLEGEPPAGHVDYHLLWEHRDLEFTDDGWHTHSDLGYHIVINAGWLTNYSISLAPCPSTTLFDALALSIRSAHANDNAIIDTSHSMTGLAEDLTQLNDQLWSQRPLGNHTYCKLHHLLARADEKVRARPIDGSLNLRTLTLFGTASRDNVVQPFAVNSAFAHGNLQALDAHQKRPHAHNRSSHAGRMQVAVKRRPALWFDGIDIFEVSDRVLNHRIGANIMNSTTYYVRALD